MEKEESLSDEAIKGHDVYWDLEGGKGIYLKEELYPAKDVKEAVKKLKELCKTHNLKLDLEEDYEADRINNLLLFPIIDKIVGDKLI